MEEGQQIIHKEIESAANKAPADNKKSSEPDAQTITSPDTPPPVAPKTTEGTIDAAAKTDAVKAAETIGTEKKADIELAASGEAATPAKDATQVAAVAAPEGVVKDATAPIEAQQQAENAKESAGAEKKDIEVPAAAKEVTLEKASTPAVEPEVKKEAEKVAAIKIDAGTAAKQPEPQKAKKSQQIKKSSAKSAAKVTQKKGKTAAAKYHVIAQGDTLMSLSRKYSTDPQSLRKINGLSEESILKVGSKIRIN